MSKAAPAFLIHVGPHKTGTTYLQTRFEASRDALAACGVLYPTLWTDAPGAGHAALPARLRAGDGAALTLEFARLLASDAGTVLISAEDLAALDQPALVLLRDLLGGRPVRFVFYVRRWSELLPSIWQERVIHGQGVTLSEFLMACLRNPAEWQTINVALRLENFETVFGPDCLRIVAYSELRDRGIDLFTHFAMQFLDWTPDLAGPSTPVNASRGPASIEIVRLFNSLSRRRGLAPKDRLRVALDRLLDKDLLAPVHDAIALHTQQIRVADRYPGLQTVHDALVVRYHAHLVPPKRPGMLFRGAVRDIAVAEAGYLLEPGIAPLLRDLHAKLEKDIGLSAERANM